MSSTIKLQGEFDLIHIRDNEVVSKETIKNLVVNVGKEYTAKLACGMETDPWSWIQIGHSGDEPTGSQTALINYYTEAQGIPSYLEGYRMVVSHTFTISGAGGEGVKIAEAGVFNRTRASSPTMLCRQKFTERTLLNDDNLQVVWRVTFG